VAVDTEAVIRQVRRYAADVRRVMPVNRVVLYGSHAKGTADELSDVDVCFFLDSFGGKQRLEILTELFGLTRGYKEGLEPNVFPASEIDNDNPFVKEILRTGREIS
jgi:predicted nucleotidyltransferase